MRCAALVLLDVVGSGCGALCCRNAAPHSRYQPHPAEQVQHTAHSTHGLCSPEDGHNDARNMLRQC